MRILLLSAYAAQSHVHWQQSLQAMFPQWHWQVLSLPPRYFSWRVRGNPLSWALPERATLEAGYDLLLATSMVDLATLRGLVPCLAQIPSVLYFHENQFAYPQDRQQHSLLEAQMVSLYGALAADQLLFNSRYNRDTFLAGVEALLQRLPDHVPPGVANLLASKSRVLPVPVDPPPQLDNAPWPGQPGDFPERPLRLLWLGRFEHDKGGEGLYETLCQLEAEGPDYELAVIGQQFRDSPPVVARIAARFDSRLVRFGYLQSREEYQQVLGAADIVLSTALHEFQGLAVLEAVAAGCLPVVPARLSYPEIYPSRYCYASSPDDPAAEAGAAVNTLRAVAQGLWAGLSECPDVSAFYPASLADPYRELFTSVTRGEA